MSAAEKRCYYEVLNLPQTCTQDEIKSSYKKLALLRHPDKLIQTGATSSDATSSFQELRHAYDVLSDPKERSWYDSHRSQILFSDFNSVDINNSKDSFTNLFPDLFSYFSATCYTDYSETGKGFYKVYGDLFNRVYANEVNYCRKLGLGLGLGLKEAPVIGGLGSDYGQVTAFYGYWGGFVTVMDFGWVSKWDAKAGGDRRTRRVMEEENKKVRKKARREFNETVRGLAEFVKKRDKRVIEMGVRRERERERRREEEVARRKERERERVERARAFESPEWARVEEEVEEEEEEEEGTEEKRELYCEVCGKKFKSEKQWMNHEKSRKHKDRVAELRRIFEEDEVFEGVAVDGGDDGDVRENGDDDGGDRENGDVRENGDDDDGDEEVRGNVEDEDGDVVDDGFLSAEDEDDFGEGFRVGDEKGTVEVGSDEEEDELNEKFKECVGLEKGKGKAKVVSDDEEANGDEDASVLEAMLSGRRGGKRVSFKDETEVMEFNNIKVKKKSRRAKKDKGKSDGSADAGENSKATGSSNVSSDGDEDDDHRRGRGGKKAAERKSKRDAESKAKNSSKGRKQKVNSEL